MYSEDGGWLCVLWQHRPGTGVYCEYNYTMMSLLCHWLAFWISFPQTLEQMAFHVLNADQIYTWALFNHHWIFTVYIHNTKSFSVWGWEVGNCTPENGFVPWTMAHIFISHHPSKHVLAYLWLIVWLKLTQSYRSTEFVQRNGETFSGFGLAIHSTKVCPIIIIHHQPEYKHWFTPNHTDICRSKWQEQPLHRK